MSEAGAIDSRETHEAHAKKTNGEVWSLLEKTERTSDEDERMVLAAHASCYHWLYAGTSVHRQRGEWILARVSTVLGRQVEALRHARRCLELSGLHAAEMKDFDLAYAQEAMARAVAMAGDAVEASRLREMAERLGEKIQDDEDRRIFQADLRSGPWSGLEPADRDCSSG